MKCGCWGKLEEEVVTSIVGFQQHVRVKHIQAQSLESCKQDKTVITIIQMDFAMAYSCEYQNEVQSALWNRSSVTLFTVAIFKDDECDTYLIVSDTKGKSSIYTFVRYLVREVIAKSASTCGSIPRIVFFIVARGYL